MSNVRVRGACWLAALPILLALPLAARTQSSAPAAASADDPSALPSEIMPRASKVLLLDVVKTATGFFAVGERGHVLKSIDGNSWAQLATPTRSALTSIAAVDGQLWSAGHDGVIIHSADAGKTWTMQRRDPYTLAAGEHSVDHDPRQGAPILDIFFSDANNGIAVGAHSLMLVSHDGGASWTAQQAIAQSGAHAPAAAPIQGDVFSKADLQLDEEADPHFNAIASAGPGTLVIVGERGTFLRSSDGGAHWQKLGFPYKGSMFGVLSLGGARLLSYGLRGNVYESTDLGSSWNKVATQGSASVLGGVATGNGGAMLVGMNGTVLSRATADSAFAIATYKNANGETPALSGIAEGEAGNWVLVGDKGVGLYHLQ